MTCLVTVQRPRLPRTPAGVSASRHLVVSHVWLGLVTIVFCGASYSQNATVYLEQGELKRASRAIAALGAELAGDKVDLYTGSLSLTRTDVDLPGNNALRVAWGHRINLSTRFGGWEPHIPRVYGIFASGGLVTPIGWVTNGNISAARGLRCSKFGAPPFVQSQNGSAAWEPDDFWSGNRLYVPGEVDEVMMSRSTSNTAAPTDGQAYPIVTKSNWQIRCLSALTVGTGEGFIALSPTGTQYRFDRMISRPFGGLTTGQGSMGRQEVWILPSVVTDRFGNTVTYNYDPANPSRPTSIVASDGRSLTMGVLPDGSTTVFDGTRTWTYTGNQVILPDNSRWTFNIAKPALPAFSARAGCSGSTWYDGAVLPQPTTNTITHPSGATVSFTMEWVMHGNAGIGLDPTNPCPSLVPASDMLTPTFPVRSVISKTITGPGLPALTWLFNWGPHNGSWYCAGSCPTTKTLTVTDPRSYKTRYTFGNRFEYTEGQLLQVDEGWNESAATALRTTTSSYRSAPGPYPTFIGGSGRMLGSMEQTNWPLEERAITVQGVTFTRRANSFDAFARPVAVTQSSTLGYSRTDTTAYSDNLSRWVLGAISSVTESSTLAVPILNS